MRMWAAQAVSLIGSSVTLVSLPIIAAAYLGATPQQMGLLAAAGTAPGLLLRLPTAGWADARPNRIPVMVACNVVSGLLVASIPLLWSFGVLRFASLLVIALAMSAVSTVGGVFAAPVLPEIVAGDQLVDANGKFGTTRSIAEVSGRSLAGVLIHVVSAPLAVLIDAASFLVAAVLTQAVRVPPARRASAEGSATLRGLAAGVASLLGSSSLRAGVGAAAYLSFANGLVSALLVLYMVETLALSEALVGPILGVGAVGGILGSLLVNTVHRRLGPGSTLTFAAAVLTLAFAGLPFGRPGPLGILVCFTYELLGSFGAMLLVITVFSEVPRRVPPSTIARSMAVMSLIPEGSSMLGALAGGALGAALGIRSALGASFAFVLLADAALALLLLSSRRRRAARDGGSP
ncbi:uncharacterized protein SOCE26_100460 [Sorangium cellulosum]|uniref:MFS transporter n=2 Tax=Sorangium cellulosum TaxID=56 RepID=A0A2L0FA91_SORCE|nr:uncharacterized protein SOCE26_100460 [Sorangium cellulosum]